MARIALATSAALPSVPADDAPLRDELARRGHVVEAPAWDDPGVQWQDYDAVLVRSAEGGGNRPGEFLDWVRRLEAAKVPLWNPPPLVRWNLDKAYLRDLTPGGTSVVPTVWLAQGSRMTLAAMFRALGASELVVKPSVKRPGEGPWRVSRDAEGGGGERFRAMLEAGGVLVQPYLPQIETEGEWSLVFLGGEFSHAVLKHPAEGDFRAREEHGSRVARADPPDAYVRQARTLARALDGPWLYARVDGIGVKDRLVLLGLGLVGPGLFLRHEPEAAGRLADAVEASFPWAPQRA